MKDITITIMMIGLIFIFQTPVSTEECNLKIYGRLAAEDVNITADDFSECGVDVDYRQDMSDVTLLYLAASNDHHTAIRRLLDFGAKFDALVETDAGAVDLLSYAVRENDTIAITNLLDYGADVNIKSTCLNISPVHWAVYNNDKYLVEILIRYRADVNAKIVKKYKYYVPTGDKYCKLTTDQFKSSKTLPLGLAVERCSDDLVELLVRHGSSVDDTDGKTSHLITAIYDNCEKVANKLLDLGASTNSSYLSLTPTHWAVDRLMRGTVQRLLKGGLVNVRDAVGKTPLHHAVEKDEKITFLLLDHGAEINAKDKEKKTPLHFVSFVKIAEILIKNGAEIDPKDSSGRTPLHYAKTGDIAEILLAKGADINSQDKYNETPLHRHGKLKNSEVIKVLLDKDANMEMTCQEHDIFIKDSFEVYRNFLKLILHKKSDNNITDIGGLTTMASAAGVSDNEEVLSLMIKKNKSLLNPVNYDWPPLHVAVCSQQFTMVMEDQADKEPVNLKFLIKNGADVNIRDAYKLTALHKAIMGGRTKAVRALLDLNADVNALDSNGWTPLHAAAKHNDVKSAKMLMDAGSDVNIADSSGFTTLMWAEIGYRPYFFKLMIEKNLDLTSQNRLYYFSRMTGLKRDKVDFWLSMIHKNGHQESILDLNYDSNNIIEYMSNFIHGPYVAYFLYERMLSEQFDNIQNKHKKMFIMVADKTEDIDKRDYVMGWTALHWASACGDFEIVKMLLDKGAYMNPKSDLGHTPMYLSRYWVHVEIYNYFKRIGAVW